MFLAADGRRLDRHGAGRIVHKVARRARIGKAGPSGSVSRACLIGMHITYVVVTIVATVANGYAAALAWNYGSTAACCARKHR
jgi:hypothetical protein